jgi:hypothetical protein
VVAADAPVTVKPSASPAIRLRIALSFVEAGRPAGLFESFRV